MIRQKSCRPKCQYEPDLRNSRDHRPYSALPFILDVRSNENLEARVHKGKCDEKEEAKNRNQPNGRKRTHQAIKQASKYEREGQHEHLALSHTEKSDQKAAEEHA